MAPQPAPRHPDLHHLPWCSAGPRTPALISCPGARPDSVYLALASCPGARSDPYTRPSPSALARGRTLFTGVGHPASLAPGRRVTHASLRPLPRHLTSRPLRTHAGPLHPRLSPLATSRARAPTGAHHTSPSLPRATGTGPPVPTPSCSATTCLASPAHPCSASDLHARSPGTRPQTWLSSLRAWLTGPRQPGYLAFTIRLPALRVRLRNGRIRLPISAAGTPQVHPGSAPAPTLGLRVAHPEGLLGPGPRAVPRGAARARAQNRLLGGVAGSGCPMVSEPRHVPLGPSPPHPRCSEVLVS